MRPKIHDTYTPIRHVDVYISRNMNDNKHTVRAFSRDSCGGAVGRYVGATS